MVDVQGGGVLAGAASTDGFSGRSACRSASGPDRGAGQDALHLQCGQGRPLCRPAQAGVRPERVIRGGRPGQNARTKAFAGKINQPNPGSATPWLFHCYSTPTALLFRWLLDTAGDRHAFVKKAWRKVRAPQDRVVRNTDRGRPQGKCHRKQTAIARVSVRW